MKRHRLPALLLSFALLLTGAFAAEPAETTPAEAAEQLHALGLFQGTIAGRFDGESMALDRAANRAEALVMFVRLLGREDEAVSGGHAHIFSDVPAWAAPYVGYAYETGLAKGAGGGKFGSDAPITLGAYAAFLLRALNYEEGADFTWQTAADKGLALGLYDGELAVRCRDGMTRGDLALVSYAALFQDVKGGGETLLDSLVRLGLVDKPADPSLPEPETPADPADRPTEVQTVLDLVNEARAEEGYGPLALSDALTACATVRAEEIGALFSHTRPDGRSCFTVLEDNGVTYRAVGENIASGYHTPEEVVEAWLNSPGHRANIMNESFGKLGVGVVNDQWVQLFSD